MLVREYSDADFTEIKRLHAESGLKYDLPDVSGEGFFSKRVVCDERGFAMGVFLRRSAEAFLICDSTWRNPSWRDLALRNLHVECHKDCQREGIVEVNAFVPPEVEKKFSNRLLRLGWKKYVEQEWRCYSFEV